MSVAAQDLNVGMAGPRTGVPGPVLAGVVALAGAATMVIELGAVRLLAPWFGTSSSVWTNVIGVVLAALALGYWIGARLATSRDPVRRLALVLLLGASFAAWLPLAASEVASWFMPAGVVLHDAVDLLVWGSLAAAIVLFLPAAATLGCAGPLAVEALQQERGGSAGAAGGRVLAASTLGSLAGTFGTTHVFIPSLGVTRTFVAAALVLAACALVLHLAARGAGTRASRAAAIAAVLAIAGGALASSSFADVRAARANETLLEAVESSFQSIRVIEVEGGAPGADPMRYLRVNESLDSFQSVWQPRPGLLPEGLYYNQFALPYAWTARERGAPPEAWSVLVIGLGAGTAVRVLEGTVDGATRLETVGIEIDPAVVEVGRTHFGLESDGGDRVVVGGMDGRSALRLLDRRFDQLVIDAYANNMEIPAQLASVEAFRAMRARLVDGGWLSVNVGGFAANDPVVRAVASAAAVGLDADVAIVRVPFSRNLTLFARLGASVPEPGTREFGSRGTPLEGDVQRLVAPLEAPGAWSIWTPSEAQPYASSDDATAMERLQLRSIQLAADRLARLDLIPKTEALAAARALEVFWGDGGGSAQEAPSVADVDAVAASRALQQRGDLRGAFEAAESVRAPALRSATLTELLWGAGDPFGALEEATTGLAAAPLNLDLLNYAVDLGFIVGAGEAASQRLGRLRRVAPGPNAAAELGSWWSARLSQLEERSKRARDAVHGRRRAVAQARAVSLAALVAVGLVLLGRGVLVRVSA